MTKGIVFYISGNDINFLIPVAIRSLRKYYSGNIHIVFDDSTDQRIRRELDKIDISTSLDCNPDNSKVGRFCRKSYHHKDQYPYDINLYYDLDHLWFDDFDMRIFDQIERDGMSALTHFVPLRHHKETRLLIEHGFANKSNENVKVWGSCVGTVKGCPLIYEWHECTEQLKQIDFLKENPEELALSVMHNKKTIGVIDKKYGFRQSGKWGCANRHVKNIIGRHYHVRSYVHSFHWHAEYQKTIEDDFMSVKSNPEMYSYPCYIYNNIQNFIKENL